MTYIPTTAELEDMGFTFSKWGYWRKVVDQFMIKIEAYSHHLQCRIEFEGRTLDFYPQSKSDIETLVRLFIKP